MEEFLEWMIPNHLTLARLLNEDALYAKDGALNFGVGVRLAVRKFGNDTCSEARRNGYIIRCFDSYFLTRKGAMHLAKLKGMKC